MFSEAQRVFLRANIARDRAEVLLARMIEIRNREHEAAHTPAAPPDLPAMDRTIAWVQQMVDQLDRAMGLAHYQLVDEAVCLLDETVHRLRRGPE